MSNPVPSDKISDGKLNFESLDEVVNGEEIVTTRTGKQIMPISMIVGIVEQRKDTAIGTIDGYVAQVESSRNSAINTINQAEADVQQELQDAIARTGYNFIGEFEDGGTLESRVDALRFEGEWYRWDGALPKVVPTASTPSTEGGVGSGAWLSVGDAALRSTLETELGAAIIKNNVIAVDGLKGLAAIPAGLRRADLRYENDGFYVGSTVGGGSWKWKPDEPKANHNGGTIIDPDRVDAWDGTRGDLPTLMQSASSGSGCYVKCFKDIISTAEFGVIPESDVVVPDASKTDYTVAMQSLADYCGENGVSCTASAGTIIVLDWRWKKGFSFEGAGIKRTIIRMKARVLGQFDKFGIPLIESAEGTGTDLEGYPEISGVTIDGNKQNHTGDPGVTQECVWFSGVKNGGVVQNIEVINGPHNGIAVFNSRKIKVKNNIVDLCDGWGIHFSDGLQGDEFATKNSECLFNHVTNCGHAKERGGIDNTGTCVDNKFIGNYAEGNFKNYEWPNVTARRLSLTLSDNVSIGQESAEMANPRRRMPNDEFYVENENGNYSMRKDRTAIARTFDSVMGSDTDTVTITNRALPLAFSNNQYAVSLSGSAFGTSRRAVSYRISAQSGTCTLSITFDGTISTSQEVRLYAAFDGLAAFGSI